jgi:UDP-N-acetylglucosamine 2-epimerase (non-hydrolysing)
VTLRRNTERPETIDTGANILAGTNPEKILAAAQQMITIPRTWNNPFGTGDAAHRIIDVCKKTGMINH